MNRLRVLNRQRARKIDGALFRRVLLAAAAELFPQDDGELGIHLIGATAMAKLNGHYLNHEGSTDVITFDHRERGGASALNGELFISVDDAVAQARQFGTTWQSELVRYAVHGMLHLDGCDDHEPAARRAMKRREDALVKELSRQFKFGKLGRRDDGA